MNGAELKELPAAQKLSAEVELPVGVRVEQLRRASLHPEMKTAAGSSADQLLDRQALPTLACTVPAGERIPESDALRVSFMLPDSGEEYDPSGKRKSSEDSGSREEEQTGEAAAGRGRKPAQSGRFAKVDITLERGSSLTAVMDYRSEEDARGLAGVQTKVTLGDGAEMTLVQVVRPGSRYTFLNEAGAVLGKGARLRVIHLLLSGKHVYSGISALLSGDESGLSVDVGYQSAGGSDLDMSYESVHTGKKTECAIAAKGILRDSAKKVFRDLIDFRNGCAGSVGNETEDVMLMDEKVENRSIPVILCAEEDVVGNHGATIGRLDENLLFYMQSRGMKKEEIYEMMAKARLDAIIRKIPDTRMRCDLLENEGEEE